MKYKIESLLFISTRPLTAKALHSFLKKEDAEIKIDDISKHLGELVEEYSAEGKGIRIVQVEGQYQMVTNPEFSSMMKKYLRDERTGELSQPSLETLTIVAYRGPISKPVIEHIRGVNCSMILRNLLIRGLVTSSERNGEPVYSVTPDFLQYLGISNVKELPDYEKLNTVENLEQFLEKRQGEQGEIKK